MEQDDILKSRTWILLIHQQWNTMYVSVQSVWRIQHTVVHRVHVISVFCVKKPMYKISKQLTMMLRYILKHSTTFQNKSFVWNILTMYIKRTVNSVKFQFVIIAENRKHKQTDIKAAYKERRQQHKDVIHNIRSDALFNRHVLLTGIKNVVITCHTESISQRC